MLLALVIVGLFSIFLLVRIFIRYHPKFDLITSYNKYILLLWYNKNGERELT